MRSSGISWLPPGLEVRCVELSPPSRLPWRRGLSREEVFTPRYEHIEQHRVLGRWPTLSRTKQRVKAACTRLAWSEPAVLALARIVRHLAEGELVGERVQTKE